MNRRAFTLSAAASLIAPAGVASAERGVLPPVTAHPDLGMSGALDGKVFLATLNVDQYDAPFPDRITFDRGMFFSQECQRACTFGWTPYYTRVEGNSIAFRVNTSCADAPHSVEFWGHVTGDRIEGGGVWRVERFYWTVERHATFSGVLEGAESEQAAILSE